MAIIYFVMALVGAAAAVFALQNVDPVVIRFLGWRIEGAPLAMVIMVSVLAGIVLTALIGLIQQVEAPLAHPPARAAARPCLRRPAILDRPRLARNRRR
jgi:uncharacterized integral membrane protein